MHMGGTPCHQALDIRPMPHFPTGFTISQLGHEQDHRRNRPATNEHTGHGPHSAKRLSEHATSPPGAPVIGGVDLVHHIIQRITAFCDAGHKHTERSVIDVLHSMQHCPWMRTSETMAQQKELYPPQSARIFTDDHCMEGPYRKEALMEGGGTDGRKLTHKCCGLSYNAVVVWHLTCMMVARDLEMLNKVGNSVRKMLVRFVSHPSASR